MYLAKYYLEHAELDYAYGVKRQIIVALQQQSITQSWNVFGLCLQRTKDDSVTSNPILSLFVSSNDGNSMENIHEFLKTFAICNEMTLHVVAKSWETTDTTLEEQLRHTLLAEFQALSIDQSGKVWRIIPTQSELKRSTSSSSPLPIVDTILTSANRIVSSAEEILINNQTLSTTVAATSRTLRENLMPVFFPVKFDNGAQSFLMPDTVENRRSIRRAANISDDVILLGFYAESTNGSTAHFASPFVGNQSLMVPLPGRFYEIVTLCNFSTYLSKGKLKEEINCITSGMKRANSQLASTSTVCTARVPLSLLLASKGLFEDSIEQAEQERQHELKLGILELAKTLAEKDNIKSIENLLHKYL